MTTHIMHQHQPVWSLPTHQSYGGSTWSKRMASAIDSDSWEVRAFAEDASSSGQWPPRSYSCSFCQREFRTAQALGGHMNVHRRERAHANQLAQLRSAAASVVSHSISFQAAAPASAPGTPSRTAEFLTPKSLSSHLTLSVSGSALMNSSSPLSSSPPSQGSISSSSTETSTQEELDTKPFLQSIPDIFSETLSQQIAWTPSRATTTYHPYEKSRSKPGSQPKVLGRFSMCLNKVMGEHEDTLDLELRLGRSSCAV